MRQYNIHIFYKIIFFKYRMRRLGLFISIYNNIFGTNSGMTMNYFFEERKSIFCGKMFPTYLHLNLYK